MSHFFLSLVGVLLSCRVRAHLSRRVRAPSPLNDRSNRSS